jgi:hypothetical protein
VLFPGRRIADLLDADETDRRLLRLGTDLQLLLEGIVAAAPGARVVVVEYRTVLPPSGVDHPPLPPAVAARGRAVAGRLADRRRLRRRRSSLHRSPRLVSRPWTRRFHYGLRGGAPYHPNAAGMAAVPRLIAERLDALG